MMGLSRTRTRNPQHVVADLRERREVDVRLDADALADPHVVVDHRAAADHAVGADPRPLAHAGLVAHDRAGADVRPGEDDRLRADRRARLDDERLELAARGGRRPRARRLAEDRAVLHTTPSPSTTPSWTTTWAPNVTSCPTDAVGLRTRPVRRRRPWRIP